MNKKYYIIDASKSPLGRIATQAAVLLRGKNQPTFAAHINPNQVVIITNADSVYLTGTKEESKRYYRHSGYPGGIKETTFKELKEKEYFLVGTGLENAKDVESICFAKKAALILGNEGSGIKQSRRSFI